MAPRSRRGVTLLEVIVVIGLVTALASFAADFMRSVISIDAQMRGILLAQEDARRVFRRVVVDIRLANYADNGAYPIAQADANGFTFYADADGDGSAERIRYFLDGTTLKRGVLNPSGAPPAYDPDDETVDSIADDLVTDSLPLFEYYDSSYDGTSAPLTAPVTISSIRLVKVTVVINKNAIRAPDDQVFSTQVSLRNLKDNL